MPGACFSRFTGMFLISVLLALPALAADPNPATIRSERGAWPLYRQWNRAEIQHFATWIEHIYKAKAGGDTEQRLAKLEQVLTDPEMNLLLEPAFAGDPSNPQLPLETIRAMHQVIDCAKLTIALSAYYSYRRGLPWMNTYIRSGDGSDIRTAPYNVPAGTVSSFEYGQDALHQFFVDCLYGFCTGNYRVEPFREGAEISDTVPVALDRRYLLPGAVFYMDGHVLILAKTDDQGELYFLDSTTSPTRGIYTQHNFNAVTGILPCKDGGPVDAYAGCYRGFRIQRFPICEVDEAGNVVRVRRRTDEEMRELGYSTEQYEKLRELMRTQKIREGQFALTTLHEFIRYRMRTAKQVSPVEILEKYATQLLAALQWREEQVQRAWADVQANGPITFPDGTRNGNAFDAKGRWGEFATAETDANLRMQYFQMLTALESAVDWFQHQPSFVQLARQDLRSWTPAGLAAVVSDLKTRIFREKSFSYTNSAGQRVRLTLYDVEQRLFDLSFDPNHPPELRWGAPLNGREAASAKEAPTALPDGSLMPMRESYRRQTFYRSLTFRESEESYLKGMATEGFPMRNKFDEHLRQRWNIRRNPPLLPYVERSGSTGGFQRTASRM
ncbi:MAG: hypothetical protein HYV26_16040 [Candidatus Hydrogenedentes bacterium]|nr:hypothetical protein [Candidatus Hydrogenedentota bacterium]MBI3117144.1 hypothetical protein [Candidatus Hydrogenedentota bacterium]